MVSAWSPRHPVNCEYPITVLNGVRIFQSTKLCLAKLKCVCTIERCPSLAHHHMFNMCLHCHIHVLYLYIICNYTWIMTMSGAIHEPLKPVPLGRSCGSWATVQPWIIYVSNWIGFAKLQWDQEDGCWCTVIGSVQPRSMQCASYNKLDTGVHGLSHVIVGHFISFHCN